MPINTKILRTLAYTSRYSNLVPKELPRLPRIPRPWRAGIYIFEIYLYSHLDSIFNMDKQDAQNHIDLPSGANIEDVGRLSITVKNDLPRHDLQKWYDEYMATDGNDLSLESEVILAVKDDFLDNKAFEKEVENFVAHVENGFCLQCRTLFDSWPALQDMTFDKPDAGEDSESDDGGWEYYVSAKRFTTPEMEASTRQGCRFCALIRQALIDSETLETYRQVEGRLAQFHKGSKIALSIQNWATEGQILWPNLPGKVCTGCNSGTALETKFYTSVVPVPGMLLDIIGVRNADYSRELVDATPRRAD